MATPIPINILSDEAIARGISPPDVGKLPDAFFYGQEQQYKNQLQNLFSSGLPRTPQGDIDYPRAAEMVLQAQGAPGLTSAIAASKYGLLSNYFKNRGAGVPANPGAAPTNDQRSDLPPSIQKNALVTADSGGEPGPPNMNLTSGTITGIDRGPITGNANAFAEQPASFAERFPDQSGIPIRAQPIQYQAPSTRQSPTGDVGVVPGQSRTSGGLEISEANARRFEKAASDLFDQAEAAAALDPAMGAAVRSRAQFYADQAKIIRQGLIEQGALTPDQKAARDAGVPLLEYQRRQEAGKAEAKDYVDETKAINNAATNAANGLPKVMLGKQLTQAPGFYSGPFNELTTSFQQFRSLFGNPGSAVPAEAFHKVVNDLLQEQVKSMGQSGVGRVLQSEVAIMRQAIASMGITEQSNRALLEIVARTYRKAGELADITRNIPQGDSRALAAATQNYLRAHPMFSDAELTNPSLLGSKEPPPQSARWSKQQMLQWGAQNGLGPGSPIMFNGQLGQIPTQAQ